MKAFPYILALAVGIILGAITATVFLHFRPTLAIAKTEFEPLSDEEYTIESEMTERGMYTVEKISTSTINTPVLIFATSSNSMKVPVLVYHSVRPYVKGESTYQDAYDVTPELLEEQLKYIRDHGYTTITFAEVIASIDHGTPLPSKPVILSFDDGWQNEYIHAFPLLKKYHMKGTFFIFTNPIGRKAQWVTWNEIKEMDAAGMEIGGHSRTHPILTKIKTDKELDREIAESKKIIEKHLGHPIYAFAYPFGLENAQVVAAVKRAGYVVGRTLISGVWNDPAQALLFRGTLASDRMSNFEKLLNKE